MENKRSVKGSTAQKMKFSIKDFFSKCDQIRRKLRIWSHLLKKFLTKNFISCTVTCSSKFANCKHVLHETQTLSQRFHEWKSNGLLFHEVYS